MRSSLGKCDGDSAPHQFTVAEQVAEPAVVRLLRRRQGRTWLLGCSPLEDRKRDIGPLGYEQAQESVDHAAT